MYIKLGNAMYVHNCFTALPDYSSPTDTDCFLSNKTFSVLYAHCNRLGGIRFLMKT